MAVLNTTSPLVTPSAPMDWPLKTVPSARASMAGENAGSNDTTGSPGYCLLDAPSGEAQGSPLAWFKLSNCTRNTPSRANSGAAETPEIRPGQPCREGLSADPAHPAYQRGRS